MNNFYKLLASAAAIFGDEVPYTTEYIKPIKRGVKYDRTVRFPERKQSQHFTPHNELKEFSIQGNKVMAYSKKDAITRLKAMGKLKRKK